MNEEHLPVRLSHLLRDCSVGAIVRGPHSLMVVQDVRTWDRLGVDPLAREIKYVDRVKFALNIEKILCAPPRSTMQDGIEIGWIPALRFPTWMRCIRCGLLHSAPWRRSGSKDEHGLSAETTSEFEPGINAACSNGECKGVLEQVPWVIVHQDGYLADVDWHSIAHTDSRNPIQRECQRNWDSAYLKIKEDTNNRVVHCLKCRSNSVVPSHVPYSSKTWQQPWVREPPSNPHVQDSLALLVEINDVRVHSPVTRTALIIPPESRIQRGTVTDRLYGRMKSVQAVKNARNSLAKKAVIKRLASELRCTSEQIILAIAQIDSGYPHVDESVLSETDLFSAEYRALTDEIDDLREDEDFVTKHHTIEWKALGNCIESGVALKSVYAIASLIAVKRLKEVMVFEGFRRAGGKKPTPPDITGECSWLPAVELYGEGIFFTLNEEMLQRWESNIAVRERAEVVVKRYENMHSQDMPEQKVEISPRFLLCHILAHLIIRELEASAGYPAASLKERIYSRSGERPMAGILIYVAVPDEKGSLGGLMELAEPQKFLRILTSTIETAEWCSLDPVCSEQEGHGPGLLNRAACHACALVPETSCAYGNILLDRGYVKGAPPDIPAFLDFAGSVQ